MRKSQHTREYNRLIEAREKVGLTQLDVAGKLHTYASFVCECEYSERHIDVIKFAAFLHVYGFDLIDFLSSLGVRRGSP